MRKKTLFGAGGDTLERFSASFTADFRFAPLNVLVLILVCLAGLVVHLAIHPFELGVVIDVLAVALGLAFLLRIMQVWDTGAPLHDRAPPSTSSSATGRRARCSWRR